MRKQMIENAAFEVATQVRAVEDTIDSALSAIAELQSRMIEVRTVSGTGVAIGQPAFEQLGTALQALISARGGMARCHAELVDAKAKIPGLRTFATGDTECPDEPMARAGLRVVA